jgi:hypothetical protein
MVHTTLISPVLSTSSQIEIRFLLFVWESCCLAWEGAGTRQECVTAHPLSPTTFNQSVETVFSSAGDAVVHYLKWDLRLPGDVDGWKVVE